MEVHHLALVTPRNAIIGAIRDFGALGFTIPSETESGFILMHRATALGYMKIELVDGGDNIAQSWSLCAQKKTLTIKSPDPTAFRDEFIELGFFVSSPKACNYKHERLPKELTIHFVQDDRSTDFHVGVCYQVGPTVSSVKKTHPHIAKFASREFQKGRGVANGIYLSRKVSGFQLEILMCRDGIPQHTPLVKVSRYNPRYSPDY